MIDRPGLLHRAWRMLPAGARRRALMGAAGVLAPRAGAVAAVAPGLAVAGPAGVSGLSEGARLMLAGLAAADVPGWAAGRGAVPPPGVPLALHLNAAALPLEMLRLGRGLVRGRRLVGVWPWELPTVPPGWRAGFRYVHAVWAPSAFAAEAVRRVAPAGFPVEVVPYPVACGVVPGRFDLATLGVPAGAFVTLCAFNLASSFARKNPLGAVAAHRAAFGGRADRVLLLRVGHPESFPADFARIAEAVRGVPNVVLDVATRPREAAQGIVAAADCVLSLHRSEGFGLVPAEAMAHGVPVVATAWSGTEDFLRDGWAVRVPFRLVPAADPRGVFEAPGACWAEPEVEAAAAGLRRLAEDEGLRGRMGAAGAAAAGTLLGAGRLAAAVAGL